MKVPRHLVQHHAVLFVALVAGTISLDFVRQTNAVWAQPPKVVKIGILTDAMVPWHSSTNGFRDGLKELGYVEGKNVRFEARASKGDYTYLPKLAADLLEQEPDLLFCVSDACPREIGKMPMVFARVSDPVNLGLVEDISRPGGHITGIASMSTELAAKRLELFKEIVPSLRRVLVTFDPRWTEKQTLNSARSAAKRLTVTLVENPITNPLEIETPLAKLTPGGHDGIFIIQSGTNLNIPGRSLQVAISTNIPTMYPDAFWSEVGALASYGPDQYSQGHQAARLAHRILSGTPPRELPVELPHSFEFVINLKTAKSLALQVPNLVLFRATLIIR